VCVCVCVCVCVTGPACVLPSEREFAGGVMVSAVMVGLASGTTLALSFS